MHTVSFILLIVGGLNWLLFGLFGTEVGSWIGGMMSMQAKIVYILVGLAALYELFTHKQRCKMCDKGMSGMGGGMKTGM